MWILGVKRVQKLRRLKSQAIVFRASQTERREPLDFLPGISGFPI